MRVLIAPDKFAGTLTASQAAQAIAAGWRTYAPGDVLVERPMADGGPGFLDVVQVALGGELLALTVRGPLGELVPAAVLVVDGTAYVESAQACGLALTDPDRRRPMDASTYGVGELVAAAVDAGARRVVIGLGGSGTNDGGAGLLAALGAIAEPAGVLEGGPAALKDLSALDLDPAYARLRGVEMVAATDVENPLLGLRGASNIFGAQKGLPEPERFAADGALSAYAHAVASVVPPGADGPLGSRLSLSPGAGAAGGLGYALLALGATRVAGIATVAQVVGLTALVRGVDLVITGEGSVDPQTLDGKVVTGVARIAADAARPCVVLGGRVDVSSRELRAYGIESAYAMTSLVGEQESLQRPAQSLSALAARVARTWSPQRRT